MEAKAKIQRWTETRSSSAFSVTALSQMLCSVSAKHNSEPELCLKKNIILCGSLTLQLTVLVLNDKLYCLLRNTMVAIISFQAAVTIITYKVTLYMHYMLNYL